MKKKFFILPVLSTVLLAPAFLAHQVSAEEAQANPEQDYEIGRAS